MDFIWPGNPVENVFIEAFNRWLRDECLNVNQFISVADAQATIEAWRVDDSQRRPHGSLGHLTPNEFVAHRQIIRTVEEVVGSRRASSRHGAKVTGPSLADYESFAEIYQSGARVAE